MALITGPSKSMEINSFPDAQSEDGQQAGSVRRSNPLDLASLHQVTSSVTESNWSLRGVVRLVFWLLGLGLMMSVISASASILIFVDGLCLLLVVGCTISFTLACHPPQQVLQALRAAMASQVSGPTESARHMAVLTTIRSIALASGLLGTLIGAVMILARLKEIESVGPALAIALLTTLYGVFIAEFCVAPLINRLKRR